MAIRACSRSISPPQTPKRPSVASAKPAQFRSTGHRRRTALAAASRAARTGPRSSSRENTRPTSATRQAACACHSHPRLPGRRTPARVGPRSAWPQVCRWGRTTPEPPAQAPSRSARRLNGLDGRPDQFRLAAHRRQRPGGALVGRPQPGITPEPAGTGRRPGSAARRPPGVNRQRRTSAATGVHGGGCFRPYVRACRPARSETASAGGGRAGALVHVRLGWRHTR